MRSNIDSTKFNPTKNSILSVISVVDNIDNFRFWQEVLPAPNLFQKRSILMKIKYRLLHGVYTEQRERVRNDESMDRH